MKLHLTTALLCLGLTSTAFGYELRITPEIVDKIYTNETGGNPDNLIYHNPKEGFCSIGIGHFLWFTDSTKAAFKETFPALLTEMNGTDGVFFDEVNTTIPDKCPWKSQTEVDSAKATPLYKKLFAGLTSTKGKQLQVKYMAFRAAEALDEIIIKDKEMSSVIEQLLADDKGTYAVIDYVNFKGNSASGEDYNGHTWGLDTVLAVMPSDTTIPLMRRFEIAAETTLEARVREAKVLGKDESMFLPGWKKRIETY